MIRWHNLFVRITCVCEFAERIEDPTPDQQKWIIRCAKQHKLATGHDPTIERAQIGVEL